jgi:hypothetical protein
MFWPKAIFTLGAVGQVNMAFGPTGSKRITFWGVAPGYGENRPSAKRSVANAELQNLRVGLESGETPLLRWNELPTLIVSFSRPSQENLRKSPHFG